MSARRSFDAVLCCADRIHNTHQYTTEKPLDIVPFHRTLPISPIVTP
ncbi:MAG: hypothetical protein RLN76_02880 [Phycisphaeraceae bacterium]